MKHINLLLFFLIAILINTSGQNEIKISGQVIDSKTKEPLNYASVFIKNRSIGTTTNQDGYFNLVAQKEHNNDSLTISFMGYKSEAYLVSECNNVKIFKLQQCINKLNEVTVKSKKKKRSAFLDISLKEALVRAEKEKKNVFLNFSDNSCGFSKYMDVAVYENDTVINELREKYIPLNINTLSWNGESLRKEFEIYGTPTFLIIDSKKTELKRNFGRLETPKFREFISTIEVVDSVKFLSDKKYIEERKKQNQIIFLRPGLKIGFTNSDISNYNMDSKLGYDFQLFFSITKSRYIFRPGISILSKGGMENGVKLNLTYLQLPLDIGLTIHKIAFLGIQSGIRVYVSPYTALLLNNKGRGLRTFDYGFKYGIGIFYGGFSMLELMITSEMGLSDINKTYQGVQGNRLLGLSLSLTL